MIASEFTDWNQATGNVEAAEVAVDDLVGEEGEGAAGLLEEHPEQDVEGEDDQHRDRLVARDRAVRGCLRSAACTHRPTNIAVSTYCSAVAPSCDSRK